MDEEFNKTDDIHQLCRHLPEPRNYFVGRRPPEKENIENLLLFSRYMPPFQSHKISHYRYVLIRPLENSGTVLLDNLTLSLKPGQILLIQPQQFHHFTDFPNRSTLWLFMTFEFARPERYASLKDNLWKPDKFQTDCLNRIVETYSGRKGEIPELLLQSLLEEWLVESQTKGTEVQGLSEGDRIGRTISLIFKGLGKTTKIGDLARETGFSESHLRALFKKKTGLSLGRYMRQIRIHRACLLLVKTDNPVGEIGSSCGFESPYSFSRTFKKETGLSPREYRISQGVKEPV